VLAGFPDKSQIGDKGYIGKRMITPIRKPECRDLLDWEREFNTQVDKIRYMVERVIANFKPRGLCTPTTVARSTPLTPPSQPLSDCTSTGWRE
jgi:DDE superfamily endonuclease